MIKINTVTKKYGENTILENCSYAFPQKGIVCLLGASGGGKTTLLNLLAGLDTDYEGDIFVGQTAINGLDKNALCNYRKDNTGFVFQNYHLLPSFTVLENVMVACELTEESEAVSRKKAKALLEKLGLSEKENQKVETLSGGQKQRVAMARALVNDPQIIFADEPTGALDRTTSTEIMGLLSEIAKDRLVIVITHDPKICDFADEMIRIQDKTIVTTQNSTEKFVEGKTLKTSTPRKVSTISRGKKNFKAHIKRYTAVSLAISIGMLAFLFSLSFGNVMDQSIDDFKTKNTAFNNGYIRGADDGTILAYLNEDARIENVYYQYKLETISLSLDDQMEVLAEKFPTAKATEGLSYGVMPRREKSEIALTPSLGKKFDSNIKNLLGKKMILEMDEQKYILTVSGIYNAGYDDFFVSADIEEKLYEDLQKQSNYSISYDVKDFSDIVAISNGLKLRGLASENAADEVYALQTTFHSLNKLFLAISVLILGIGLFICGVLLIKLQNTRYRELGLMSALGFNGKQISSMILAENLMLSALATAINLVLLGVSVLASKLLEFPLIVGGAQIAVCIVATFAVVLLMSGVASYRLVRTEPAEALRR